jgi:hypothetical protein
MFGLFVSYMHFMFNSSLADSGAALRITHWMAALVPAIRGLPKELASSGNYWGLFFSLFWASAPVYGLLGYLGAPFLSEYRYKKYVIDTTLFRVICIFLMFSFGVLFLFVFPILSGMWITNQSSDNFTILLFSWWLVVGAIYYQAQALHVLIMKVNRISIC